MSAPDHGPGHPLAAAAGVHPIELPTPFPVGDVNCWLVEDDPLTLVDVGPATAAALVALERGLAARDRRIEDLERVLLTHEHADHLGLTDIVLDRSGAELVVLDALAPRMERADELFRRETRFTGALMERHGVPTDVVLALVPMQRAHAAFANPSVPVGRTVADGETVEFADRTLRVHHRPGHSMTDTIFVDEARRLAIGGDHLLEAISSNPLMACEPERLWRDEAPTADDRVRTLPRYEASLSATARMGLEVVVGGHGPPVTDVAPLVAERARATERRKAKIHGLLPPEGATAFEIGRRMWGDVALKSAYLVISEVVGHLDLLEADGAVAPRLVDGVERWLPQR
ncbi:MBL fold metallo-hydrolase [Patulibacter brassicae]|uniref:MBL fold metallo-hydrolase n=1 Tax=Patulibacter brassicae TaxID=1705717 RepID=A0ABU4VF77_9ACTN|nr:MBL fold metallo-hydrolase [Patulibacter brassicae]MDX8150002.1 MBL fold metallo-hydrolase [Patulibacter brassicae]